MGVLSVAIPAQAFALGAFSISSPSNGAWVGTLPTFSWTAASLATSYTLTIVPSAGAAMVKTGITTTSYTLASGEALLASAGPFAWHVTAYDAAAGSFASSSWSFFVDATPPGNFALTSPEPNAWTTTYNASVTWNAATDTGSGVAKYRVYVDGILCGESPGTSTGAGINASSCNPGEGTHYWSVAAVDGAGNLTWCLDAPGGTGGRPFRIDDTGPDEGLGGGVFKLGGRNIPSFYSQPVDYMLDTGLNFNQGEQVQVSATGTWCFLTCTTGCYTTAGVYSVAGGVPAPNCYSESLLGRIGAAFSCVGSGARHHARTALGLGCSSVKLFFADFRRSKVEL